MYETTGFKHFFYGGSYRRSLRVEKRASNNGRELFKVRDPINNGHVFKQSTGPCFSMLISDSNYSILSRFYKKIIAYMVCIIEIRSGFINK